jgi:class 3 adenylate cyclase/tetratricopeptide (TPR) repeat protein
LRCSSCNSESPDATKFCGNCGKPLGNRCTNCGSDNPPRFKFCGECGTALTDVEDPGVRADGTKRAGTNDATLDTRGSTDGERRHLTVLFCDLVGSTEIEARLDPEEWRETVAGYHRAAAEEITRFGGHVAKYLGDGVMALFGYPEAHDNDAERAARAALSMIEAIGRLNQASGRSKLSARVGIDSGAVVVGAGAGKDADVFGDAPNIAARVQAVAEPDTVMITEATQRLVAGLFVLEEHGAESLKGIERPVKLYRVARSSGMRGRLEAEAAVRGMTSFVGREDELRLLMNRWERVREGQGQVVTIVGEAGIGKSRLLQRFRAEIGSDSHTWLECATAPFYQNTPFYAVEELLRQSLHWDQRFAALEASLAAAATSSDGEAPILAPAKSPDVANPKAPTLTAEQERKHLLANLVGWTLDATHNQPLVIATEDLHWADPSTLELIQLMVEQGATSRLLLLYTARPEFRPNWPMRAHHTQITLNRLSAQSARAIIAEVMASRALAGETIDAVVERTGGVPLFVEELTRAVLEGGANLAGRAIPVTLHDSLMARLDRLGPAKEVAQIGAVIGSEFSYELLRAVHPLAQTELEARLRALVDAELIYVRGIAPNATYQFKHALIRDAAYEALLKSRRKELHLRVARAIEEKFPAIKETQPEVLARHWTEAGETRLALIEWQRAATAADTRASFLEAAEGYQRALALMEQLDESDEMRSHELELSSALVRVLTITKGLVAPESVRAATRARAVAEKSGSLSELVLREYATWNTVFGEGNHSKTAALAGHLLEIALREGSSTSLAFAHQAELSTALWCGELAKAEDHFRSFSLVCDEADFKEFPAEKLVGFSFASVSAWISGRPDVARQRMARAVSLARESAHPYELAFASFLEAWLYRLLREPERAEAANRQAIELSEKHDFPLVRDMAQAMMGGIVIASSSAEDRLAIAQQGFNSLVDTGARAGITDFMYCLAVAHEKSGQLEAAERKVNDALTANPDEKAFLPNLLRYQSELWYRRGEPSMAETGFQNAIALARSMGAKSWELRSAISLARLLSNTHRRNEAHSRLAETYEWFTEGFDTADLKDAKALLDDLSA